LKPALVVLWIACALAFVLPESGWTGPGQMLFIGLVVVHAIEFLVFLPKLRSAGGSLGHHFVQTMLFGFIHLRGVQST
jgi:uncharacterized protein YhhL (DUF1145 family)